MTKEDYLAKIKQANEAIKAINEQKKEIDRIYIETNKPCNIGDKIQVGWRGIGFCTNLIVSSDGDVYPKAVKCKKDGTPSRIPMFIWRDDKIEVLESVNK